ncbi:MAG TPA: hypothetical protein VN923_15010, partial [Thermoanaerobaculia bacterium]|nr:hypothetical protein [Thermoanaerobaculia bacterium]
MNARLVALAIACLAPTAAFAQHFHHHAEAAAGTKSVCDKPYADPVLIDGLQKVQWDVLSTGNDTAKRHFRQGMTLLYGFNYEDALRNFRKATTLDDNFAMAWWGMAMAAGPNINLGMDEPCGILAGTSTDKAVERADAQHPLHKISDLEYGLIHTLPERYAKVIGSQHRVLQPVEYAVAMRRVAQANPSDPNAAALFVESLMNLRPWALFDSGGREAVGTDEALKVLRGFVDAGSTAIGINHYFIHAVEAGPKPTEALVSADRLGKANTDSGHLRHMPSHTFFLAGDYAGAARANTEAIFADNQQFGPACAGEYAQYIERRDCLQLYYGHYLAHNYFFLAVSEAFRGRYIAALDVAETTRTHTMRFLANEPNLQRYATAPLMLKVALGLWNEVIGKDKEPAPDPKCVMDPRSTEPAPCHILLAFRHYARGMAYATDPKTAQSARAELGDFRTERANVQTSGPTGWGNNRADDVLAVAEQMLIGRIEWVEGRREIAIERLKLAATREDDLVYDEPPQWVFPVRQALGGAYLAVGNNEAAKNAFCGDLRRHHGSGRSLYGMYRALEGMGTQWAAWAATYKNLYQTAWTGAPKP